ncbi:MAG: GAF domain-containing protein [Gemmatimonadetes bacterium]|nr:GAF domain-containing protein [Gemmatimonadota bacterium]
MSPQTKTATGFILYAARGATHPALRSLEDELEIQDIGRIAEAAASHDAPAILLLTDVLAADAGALASLRALPEHVVVVSKGDAARHAAQSAGRLFLALDAARDDEAVLALLRGAAQHAATLLGACRARQQLERMSSELRELNRIGLALMSERDPDRLLGMILAQARRITTSDAGSLYLVEEAEDGGPRLRFRLAQNDSIPDIPVPNITLPIDETSIAGHAASTGQPLVIDDAYEIPESAPYSFNRAAFDEKYGYRAMSMLTVPMKDHKDEVVGVLQLINRKRSSGAQIRDEESAREHVLPYTQSHVETVMSLAGQAAVSIENMRLYQAIERLFEGFIKAAVTAIDQRDPTTSGHSVRVATLTCDVAEVVDRADREPFKSLRFSREQMRELRYAGLLHDFGKVGVREEVLIKAKKLPPVMFERMEARFDLIRRTLEAEFHKRRAEHLLERGTEGWDAFLSELAAEFRRDMERLDKLQQAVREANEPRVLPEASAEILHEVAAQRFPDFDGKLVPYLTSEEFHYLSIPKGSLDDDERKQIESHVTHTYNFLLQIPWTDDLSSLADIAYGHHEKLNGSGYPRRIEAPQIPVQTRIMTISDIFDALTASDRPYKKALPTERALDIVKMEASQGLLDAALVELMIGSGVYRKVLEVDWRQL